MTITNDLLAWKEQNQLLVIKLVASKKKKTLIGRIIQYDVEKGNLIIYVDDEKNTYILNIFEIDQITPCS